MNVFLIFRHFYFEDIATAQGLKSHLHGRFQIFPVGYQYPVRVLSKIARYL